MARRSTNSHEINKKAFPFAARLRRERTMRPADSAEWHAEADRIAGPGRWYATSRWKQDYGCKLIGFATHAEADVMQRWIAESGIETRPAPDPFAKPQLTVGSYNQDRSE